MCDLIEQYAKKEAIRSVIAIYIEEFNFQKEEIIARIIKKFDITEEEAANFYDEVAD